MRTENDTAFPLFTDTGLAQVGQRGLTKREYFAACALQGILSAQGSAFMEAAVKSAVIASDQLLRELENANQ